MIEDEVKTISFTFSYNDVENNETTISKVVDLDEKDETGILTLLEYFTKFLQLSGYYYVKALQVCIDKDCMDKNDKNK